MTGFATLGGPHLLMLAGCLVAGAVLVCAAKKDVRIIRLAAVVLIALEVLQDIYLLSQGKTILYHLPLHLCGLGIFTNLIGAFSDSKFAVYLREVSLVLIAPGAVFALLFPDWTYMPLLSMLSVIGFTGHTLLVAVPLMMLHAGMVRPEGRHFWYPLAFLAVVSLPVYVFDRAFGCNYMFLRQPVEDTPLAWWADRLGDPGYLLGILLMIVILLVLEYGLAMRFCKAGSMHRKDV